MKMCRANPGGLGGGTRLTALTRSLRPTGAVNNVRVVAVTAISLTCLSPSPIATQGMIISGEDPSCPGCQVIVKTAAVLGDEGGQGYIEKIVATAVRQPSGRYLVFSSYGTEIDVFDRDGTYVRTIGGEGGGPEEFRGIGSIDIGPGDSVHIFDNVNVRQTVLSDDLEFVRTVPLELAPTIGVEVLPDGRVLLPASVHSPERIGLPLHLLDRRGGVIRSFGSKSGVYRPDVPFIDERVVALSLGGRVWSGYRNWYRIELWDTTGTVVPQGGVERRVDWFPVGFRPVEQEDTKISESPPEPRLQAIRQDDNGLLWVLVLIPDEAWREALEDLGGGHGGRVTDFSDYYDTRVEIIDVERGVLVQSVVVPEALLNFAGDGYAAGVFTNDLGVPFIKVVSMTVERRQRQ